MLFECFLDQQQASRALDVRNFVSREDFIGRVMLETIGIPEHLHPSHCGCGREIQQNKASQSEIAKRALNLDWIGSEIASNHDAVTSVQLIRQPSFNMPYYSRNTS